MRLFSLSKYLYLCPHVLKLRRRSVKILSCIETWTLSFAQGNEQNAPMPMLLYTHSDYTKGIIVY